jgi:hypothetical protein
MTAIRHEEQMLGQRSEDMPSFHEPHFREPRNACTFDANGHPSEQFEATVVV